VVLGIDMEMILIYMPLGSTSKCFAVMNLDQGNVHNKDLSKAFSHFGTGCWRAVSVTLPKGVGVQEEDDIGGGDGGPPMNILCPKGNVRVVDRDASVSN
jgi:hypothetical protein